MAVAGWWWWCAPAALASAPARAAERLAASEAAWPLGNDEVAVLRLSACGDAFCVEYSIDRLAVRAIVDTGSPFLNSPIANCARSTWLAQPDDREACGLARLGALSSRAPLGLEDTVEIFGGSTGVVRWREGALQLGPLSARRVAFGVPDDALLRPPGGLFFGLLKRRAKGIRPTLLEQLPSVAAVRLELTAAPTLALSRKSLIARDDPRALKTVDLRPLGAPVQYLAAPARRVFANGRRVVGIDRPVVVIVDTGVTGVEIATPLYEALGGRFSQLAFDFVSEQGQRVSLSARRKGNRRFVVTPVDVPWGAGVYVVAVGLSFLTDHSLVADLDDDDPRLVLTQLGASADEPPPPDAPVLRAVFADSQSLAGAPSSRDQIAATFLRGTLQLPR